MVFAPESGPATGDQTALSLFFLAHAADNGPVLSLEPPRTCGVLVNGTRHDLVDALTPASRDGAQGFTLPHRFAEPGAHVFYLTPAPYIDREEGVAIIHHTKVILDTTGTSLETESKLGWEHWEGWERAAGLPAEIMPLNQPTALWVGNTFRAVALQDGQPVPGGRIEIEHWDTPKKTLHRPSAAYTTQLLKTNEAGEFAFSPSHGGWWVFTVILDSEEEVTTPDGSTYPVELGGALLVYFATPK
jgi:cobalt/nickel transport protein